MSVTEYESFADFFKEARRESGYSLIKMGEFLGVSSNTVYLWETGKTSPKTETAVYVAKRLGGKLTIRKAKKDEG